MEIGKDYGKDSYDEKIFRQHFHEADTIWGAERFLTMTEISKKQRLFYSDLSMNSYIKRKCIMLYIFVICFVRFCLFCLICHDLLIRHN